MTSFAFGHLCDSCSHLGSRHLWDWRDGGDLLDGPYRCLDCGCEIVRDAPMTRLTKRRYEELKAGGLPTYETEGAA
jgi:hypothetical protein